MTAKTKNTKISFGTDGIRGAANHEVTAEIALTVGRCTAYRMKTRQKGSAGRILIGKDTRVSGDMIEAALIAGITSIGVEAWRVGIVPTPGLAYLTRALNCDCGFMISASHNPAEDNGIKIFSGDGYKLEDDDEKAIEEMMNSGRPDIEFPSGDKLGRSVDRGTMTNAYTSSIKRLLRGVFIEGAIVIDCANGAASKYAKRIFKEVAENVAFMNADEDGRKINVDCGSTRPEKLAQRVIKNNAVLGFAFDGDADRVLFIDEKGELVDGDQLMLLSAKHLMKEDRLPGGTVVSTVMSNMGFEIALKEIGAKMIRTAVGDKYVLREMAKSGYNLGGEQSGHIIFHDLSTTGDGMLTAAQILKFFSRHPSSFHRQTHMKRSAQFLKNIRVPNRDAFYENAAIQKKVKEVEKRLGDQGRVVVRPSGTEPLIRVMVETWDRETAENYTDEILNTVRKELKVE
jgi:phosphoglucosamine mutase